MPVLQYKPGEIYTEGGYVEMLAADGTPTNTNTFIALRRLREGTTRGYTDLRNALTNLSPHRVLTELSGNFTAEVDLTLDGTLGNTTLSQAVLDYEARANSGARFLMILAPSGIPARQRIFTADDSEFDWVFDQSGVATATFNGTFDGVWEDVAVAA